mgnify:FL=1
MQSFAGLNRYVARVACLALGLVWSLGVAAQDKPNFLIIAGDDIGIYNLSA